MTPDLDARLNLHAPAVLSLFRAVFALLFAAHGASKLFGWSIGVAVPVDSWPSWWAGLIEFIAGALLLIGLFTRPAAFAASGQMAVAYFWQHQPHAVWPIDPAQGGHGGGEPAVLYCFAFFLLIFTGPGSYALDTIMGRRRDRGSRVVPPA